MSIYQDDSPSYEELCAKTYSVLLEEIVLNGRRYYSKVVSVYLDELAVTVENKGLFADVTQGHVLKRLKRLHNAGRIRIEDIRIGQTGMKRKRNVVGIVDLLVLDPPFKRPKNVFKEELDRNYVPERDFSKKEREVLRNALTVMRAERSVAREFAKIVGEIARNVSEK